MKIVKIFGPPGAGKTTALINYVLNLLGKNFYSIYEELLCVSFTNAAVSALLNKFLERKVKLNAKQVRTLHSLCYEALCKFHNRSLYSDLVSELDVANYFQKKGYDFSLADDYEEGYSVKLGNKIFRFIERVRHTWDVEKDFSLHFRDFYKKEKESFNFNLSFDFILKEYQEYIQFLKEKIDYTKLLIEVLKNQMCLSIFEGTVLLIDEAQDFTMLEWAVLRELMKNYEIIVIAGDDDQAIYNFAGADSRIFLDLEGDEEVVLDTSYRLTSIVCERAKKLISRNKKRKIKEFKAIKTSGNIREISGGFVYDVIKQAIEREKEVFLLCRNQVFVREHARRLYSLNIPFAYLDREVVPQWVLTMKTLINIRQVKEVDRKDVENLLTVLKQRLKQIVPIEDKILTASQVEDKVFNEVFKVLTKQKSFNECEREESKKILEAINTRSIDDLFQEFKYKHQTIYSFWKGVLHNLEAWLKPRVYLGTIHKAKGLESDVVFVDLRVTKEVFLNMNTSQDSLESERRVFYVALTRAREEVYFFTFKHKYIFHECFYL
ncbi:MAG: UvrD-helicase domain-containing protein [Brevinematia bacterium]